jgi:hypothetical protein
VAKNKKHLKIETAGKSFVYLFFEKEDFSVNFKIGVATHNKTDTSIAKWKKYAESKHPVTIERRITDFQTGNPRKIQPLAYFLYPTQNEARLVERTLHNNFAPQRSEHSKEWFKLSEENILTIISCLKEVSENNKLNLVMPEVYWIDTSKIFNLILKDL